MTSDGFGTGCGNGFKSFSDTHRLSTRPRGWSKIGVEKMSKLLYTKNGGRVYDLVMAQKLRKAAVKKREEQRHTGKRIEEIIKRL
jgi:Mor family transcriptional regulator